MTTKEFLYKVSTCGPLGEMHGGGIVASLIAIPTVIVFRLFYWLSPNLHLFAQSIFFLASVLAMYATLCFFKEKDPSIIVLDKVIGLSIAYCCLPVNIKLYIVGFLLFHIAGILLPWFIKRTWKYDLCELPHVLGVVVSDVVAGISVHILLRIIAWLGR